VGEQVVFLTNAFGFTFVLSRQDFDFPHHRMTSSLALSRICLQQLGHLTGGAA
jgi:hypothetical protein